MGHRAQQQGDLLADWADGLGRTGPAQQGKDSDVRSSPGYIGDVSWANPPAYRMVTGWRVDRGIEVLSDHLCIVMETVGKCWDTESILQIFPTLG